LQQECCIYTRCRFTYRSWVHIQNTRKERRGWDETD